MATPEAPLEDYRRKRDFATTPEPAGALDADGGADGDGAPRFVVQEHHATALHWDLRLEREGVLASWAVPKGIPPDPRVDHLAVRTEDHPMQYLDFHGDIPLGSYGGGTMAIWDQGTYDVEKFSEREVMVVLHGQRVDGRYVLFKTGGKNWMIHRMSPPADPERELVPTDLRPMRPTMAAALPDDGDAFAQEVAWDGARVIVTVDGGRVEIADGGGVRVGDRFPELRALGLALGTVALVLDGVLVAFGPDGRPERELIDRRLATTTASRVKRAAAATPAVLVAFDLLWLEGHSTTALAYVDRRKLLDEVGLAGPSWQVPASHTGQGLGLLDAVTVQGLPGVVAKRLDSTYQPGQTSSHWLFVAAPAAPAAG